MRQTWHQTADNPNSNLKKLAIKLGTDGPVKTLPTPRVVKLLHNGHYILQTTKAKYVWEIPFYPQFYVPATDLQASTKNIPLKITEGETYKTDDGTPVGQHWTLNVNGKPIDQCIAFDPHLTGPAHALAGLVKVDFGAVDQWFEEDTPIFVHPKDPFKRVDILQSRRRIRVLVEGEPVAETTASHHLYETGLPCRYYMPLTAVRAEVLRPSERRTRCPYKGEAEYYSVEVKGKLYEDVIWFYNRPTLECGLIVGEVCCEYRHDAT